MYTQSFPVEITLQSDPCNGGLILYIIIVLLQKHLLGETCNGIRKGAYKGFHLRLIVVLAESAFDSLYRVREAS